MQKRTIVFSTWEHWRDALIFRVNGRILGRFYLQNYRRRRADHRMNQVFPLDRIVSSFTDANEHLKEKRTLLDMNLANHLTKFQNWWTVIDRTNNRKKTLRNENNLFFFFFFGFASRQTFAYWQNCKICPIDLSLVWAFRWWNLDDWIVSESLMLIIDICQ